MLLAVFYSPAKPDCSFHPRRSFVSRWRATIDSMRPFYRNLLLAFMALATLPATAQIQQAWVVRYNNGITNGTNQAVKMVLDSSNNIYVTGFSQNTNGDLGYVTIKYASNGNQLWTAPYAGAALAVDTNGNSVVTGINTSFGTVKLNAKGSNLWSVAYP